MSAKPNLLAKPPISRLHLVAIGAVAVAALFVAVFQTRGSASHHEISRTEAAPELKACCVAPPISRAKALTSSSTPKPEPLQTARRD